MKDMLILSAYLPEIAFAPGDVIVREGGSAGPIWVLVSGALQVRKDNVLVNTVTRPGALVGEISLELNSGFSATVEAAEPSVMRYAADGYAFLSSDSAVINSRRGSSGGTPQLRHHLPSRPEASVR